MLTSEDSKSLPAYISRSKGSSIGYSLIVSPAPSLVPSSPYWACTSPSVFQLDTAKPCSITFSITNTNKTRLRCQQVESPAYKNIHIVTPPSNYVSPGLAYPVTIQYTPNAQEPPLKSFTLAVAAQTPKQEQPLLVRSIVQVDASNCTGLPNVVELQHDAAMDEMASHVIYISNYRETNAQYTFSTQYPHANGCIVSLEEDAMYLESHSCRKLTQYSVMPENTSNLSVELRIHCQYIGGVQTEQVIRLHVSKNNTSNMIIDSISDKNNSISNNDHDHTNNVNTKSSNIDYFNILANAIDFTIPDHDVITPSPSNAPLIISHTSITNFDCISEVPELAELKVIQPEEAQVPLIVSTTSHTMNTNNPVVTNTIDTIEYPNEAWKHRKIAATQFFHFLAHAKSRYSVEKAVQNLEVLANDITPLFTTNPEFVKRPVDLLNTQMRKKKTASVFTSSIAQVKQVLPPINKNK